MTYTTEFKAACSRLAQHPAYAGLSVAVLGVGLGVMLFLLGLVNGLVLQPMPFPQANRLLTYGYAEPHNVGIDGIGFDEVDKLSGALTSFDRTGVYRETAVDIVTGAEARHYNSTLLSSDLLGLLGVSPIIGRGFTAADTRPGAPLVILIGEGVWRRDYGAATDIVGKSVRVDGEPAIVAGVMPDEFSFPTQSQVWLPLRAATSDALSVNVVAHLADGASLSSARSQLATAAGNLGRALDGQRAGRTLVMKPLSIVFVNEKTRSYVWLMFAAGALVLLLACANVANLQLTQTLERSRELAIRGAIGATPGRLMREQLVESLIIALAATGIAIFVEHLGVRWIEHVYAASGKAPPYFVRLGMNTRLLALTFCTAMASTFLVGIVPALRARRTDVQVELRDGSKGSRGSGFARLTTGLVIFEIVLTVVLLVGAGTFIAGLNRMLATNVETGTDPGSILNATVTLPSRQYPDSATQARFFEDTVRRLAGDAGVVNAAVGNTIPGARLGSHEFVAAAGSGRPDDGYPVAQMGVVSDGFAATYGLKISEGRFLDQRDQAGTPAVTVIDREMSQALWPGRDPIGQHLILWPESAQPVDITVAGLIDEMQLDGPLKDSGPSMLVSLRQFPLPSGTLAIHTRTGASNYARRLPGVVAAVDPLVAVYGITSQEEAMAMSRMSILVLTQVFSALGIIALMLAAAGLYGVLTFSVMQRTREFGIRRAIGASNVEIVRVISGHIGWQVGVGMVLGLALAAPWSKALADPQMHTRGYDLGVFAVVIVVVLCVALLATLQPMLRALRVDPVVALRYE